MGTALASNPPMAACAMAADIDVEKGRDEYEAVGGDSGVEDGEGGDEAAHGYPREHDGHVGRVHPTDSPENRAAMKRQSTTIDRRRNHLSFSGRRRRVSHPKYRAASSTTAFSPLGNWWDMPGGHASLAPWPTWSHACDAIPDAARCS